MIYRINVLYVVHSTTYINYTFKTCIVVFIVATTMFFSEWRDSRYDIASRHLNRFATTHTHCVKLISIFGSGRERVKNLERAGIRNSEVKPRLARARKRKRLANRTRGGDQQRQRIAI